ncbi:hypothetical protein [Agromyces larvae]|uniref:Glycosyltransferase RgtA/B/C/D-like domain-containing protein n=1 Tax=Agromyces larvae TaxID=2929802 RepID=A0ABY4BZA4_9MICO|nr:hypothetical protein [Agromyces larvae]UOE44505.1 hypothetical protein MTO99_01550 [Agromyces larvae]
MSNVLAEQPSTVQHRVRSWLGRFWVPLALVLVAVGYSSAVTIQHSDAMSPIDEWVYLDYLDKLPTQGVLTPGEEIGPEGLDRMACDGVFPYGPMGAACGSSYADVSTFPFGGITSADPYTPFYFGVTRVVGDAIHFVSGVDQLTAWRLTGSLWLAASVLLLWLLLRQWRVSSTAALGLGLAFIASPFAWWTYTYVSTDAPSFLAGAALLFVTTRFVRGTGSLWWIPAIAVLATIFKVTNLLAVGLSALYLVIHGLITVWNRRKQRVSGAEGLAEFGGSPAEGPAPARRLRREWLVLIVAAATSVAAILTQFVWLRIHASLRPEGAAGSSGGNPLGVQELLGQMANFLPGTITSNVNIAGSTGYALPIPGFAVTPLSWLTIAGVIGAFWALRGVTPRSPLVIAIAISSVVFAPALALALYVTTGSYFTLPPRYGASILAGFLLAAGLVIRNRWASWILVGYGVALLGAMSVLTALLHD